MAETHEEIFRSKIEILGPDSAKILADVEKIHDALKELVTAMTSTTGASPLASLTDSPALQNFQLDIGNAKAEFDSLQSTAVQSTRAIVESIVETSLATQKYTQDVLASSRAQAKAAAESRKMAAAEERKQKLLLQVKHAQRAFNAQMEVAERQTKGLGVGLSLWNNKLLAVRTGLAGTARSTSTFVRGLDKLRNVQKRLTRDSTKQERALMAQARVMQQQGIALKNAVGEFERYSQATGQGDIKTQEFSRAIQRQMNTMIRQTNAIQANKRVTEAGVAEIENSTVVVLENARAIRTQLKAIGKGTAEIDEFISRIENLAEQQDRETEKLEAYGKAAGKSRKEREKLSKSAEKQENIFRRLGKALNIFSKNQDRTSKTTKVMAVSMDTARHSLFALTGAFTLGELAADGLRRAFSAIGDGIRTFKDEFLGMGVINEMMDDLTTNVAQFGAQLNQQVIAATVIGQQVGLTAEFAEKRMHDMRESNLASQAALDLFIKSASVSPDKLLGPLEGVAIGYERLKDAIAGTDGLSGVSRQLDNDFDALISGLESGQVSFEDSTLAIFRMAASIDDPTEQLKFLKTASDEGVLGMMAITKAAQNMAAGMGEDTSDTVNAFWNAIQRATTESAEQYGIVENASQMHERWAEIMGVTTKEMDALSKSQSVELGIIQTAIPFMEVYGAVYDTAGKKITSMRRYIEGAKEAVADLLEPALLSMLDQMKEFLISLEKMAKSEAAQKLADQFVELVKRMSPVGGFLKVIVDKFYILASVITPLLEGINSLLRGESVEAFKAFEDAGVSAITHIALFFQKHIQGAVTWGWNLIVNLANGIIDAAQTVLVAAMNYVGQIMSLFFAPGSPPERGALQNIREWGMGLAYELAGGMAEGSEGAFAGVASAIGDSFRNLDVTSFRSIKDAMSQIRGIFQAMVSSGQMQETGLAPGLTEVRELLVLLNNEFEDTGKISEDVLSQIGDRLGDAGDDMTKYLRLQLELRKAQEGLIEIDKEIAAAEAAGFVSQGLKDKRADAISSVESLSSQLDLQRELLSWQQESNSLVQQQVDLLKRIADQTEAAALAGEKGQKDQWEAFLETYNAELAALETKKALGIITEQEYMRTRLGLEQRYIDTAIKMGKPLSDERIQAFKDLKAAVQGLTGGGGGAGKGELDALSDKINQASLDAANLSAVGFGEEMKQGIGVVNAEFDVMKEKVQGLIDKIKEFFQTPLTEHFDKVITWLRDRLPQGLDEAAQSIKDKIGGAFEWVAENKIPLLAVAVGAVLAGPKIAQALGGLGGKVGGAGMFGKLLSPLKGIGAAFANLAAFLLGPLLKAIGLVGSKLLALLGPVGLIIAVVGTLIGVFVLFKDEIQEIFGNIGKWFEPIGDVIEEVVARVYGLFKTLFVDVANAIGTLIKRVSELESLRRLAVLLVPVFQHFARVIGVILAGALVLLTGILTAFSAVLEPIIDIVVDIIDVLLRFATIVVESLLLPFRVIQKVLQGDLDGAKEIIDSFVGDVEYFFEGLIDFLVGFPAKAFGVMLDFTLGFLDGIVGAITGEFGLVYDFFDDFVEKFGNIVGTIFDASFLGKGLDVATRLFSKAKDKILGSTKEAEDGMRKFREAINIGEAEQNISSSLTGMIGLTKIAMGEMESIAEEHNMAKPILEALATTNTEISRLWESQKDAEKEYHAERQEILENGNIEELKLLDERYAEEKRKRRLAIGESILDLNEQILQEKLAREGLTGAEAAALVTRHQEQAVEIAAHYGLPEEAADRMTETAVTALREVVLGNEEYLESTGKTTGEALEMFDSLEEDGYGGLAESSKEAIKELVVDLALMQQANGESFGAISNTLSVLPGEYQTAVLAMMGENANLEEILAALNNINITVTPTIEMSIRYASNDAKKGFKRRSPTFEIQGVIENLVEYAKENPVQILISLSEGSLEAIKMVTDAIMNFAEEAIEMAEEVLDSTSDVISSIEDMSRRGITAIRRMTDEVVRLFRRAVDRVIADFRRLERTLVQTAHRIGVGIAQGIVEGLKMVGPLLEEFFIDGEHGGLDWDLWHWGMELMKAVANGMLYGFQQFVVPVLKKVRGALPDSPAKWGPLSTEPDWSYLTDGFANELSKLDLLSSQYSVGGANGSMVGAAQPVGGAVNFYPGSIEMNFPGVSTAEDANQIVGALNELTERGIAFGRIGSF